MKCSPAKSQVLGHTYSCVNTHKPAGQMNETTDIPNIKHQKQGLGVLEGHLSWRQKRQPPTHPLRTQQNQMEGAAFSAPFELAYYRRARAHTHTAIAQPAEPLRTSVSIPAATHVGVRLISINQRKKCTLSSLPRPLLSLGWKEVTSLLSGSHFPLLE